MGFIHSSEIVKNILGKFCLSKDWIELLSIWEEQMYSYKGQYEIQMLDKGKMIVSVVNPSLAQELNFQRKEIIRNLNKKLNKSILKDIKFIVAQE